MCNMIELLAIDMDGTLLNSRHQVTDRTLQALQNAAEAGITIVPTTGRPIGSLPHRIVGEAFYRYVISSNGACTTDLQTGKELYEAEIDREKAIRMLRACSGMKHVGVSAHVEHLFVLQGRLLSILGRLSYGRDARKTRTCGNLITEVERRGKNVEELQLFYFSDSARTALEAMLAEVPQIHCAWTAPYVEVFDAGASKGRALAALAQSLKIPREKVACIGDAENDFSMFDAAGVRFAMGNAIDALKARADQVLPSNDEDGVAAAIDRLLKHS